MRRAFPSALVLCLAALAAPALEACISEETSLNPQPLPPEDEGRAGSGDNGGERNDPSAGASTPPPAGADGGADGDSGGE